jgi:TetR/AcrR family tetracycline transcriptional repressor
MSSRAKRARVKRRRAPGPASATHDVAPPSLSRARVINEALALLDRDGLERFSLRRLADHLGVTPMAMYNHVANRRDLLQAIADTVVSNVEYRVVRGDWQKVVAACFRTLRTACLAHPGAVALVESAEVLPAAIFRPMEITLTALEGAGLRAEDALRAYSLLITFTLGQVNYQIKGWSRGVDPAAAASEGRITRRTLPAVVDATDQKPWDFDQAFEFGLSVILAGLNAKLRRR